MCVCVYVFIFIIPMSGFIFMSVGNHALYIVLQVFKLDVSNFTFYMFCFKLFVFLKITTVNIQDSFIYCT